MLTPWTIGDRARLAFLLAAFFGLVASRVDGAERMAPARLLALVERFAGAAATIDARLILPDCAAPAASWAVPARAVAVVCDDPAWRIFVPVAGAAAARPAIDVAVPAAIAPVPPAVRRGDRVMVEAGGPGFRVGAAAIADGDARDGRISLRNAATGVRIAASVATDGSIVVAGLNPMVNRR